MTNPFETLTFADLFVVYLYILLFTTHISLFVDILKFKKTPSRSSNFAYAGFLSAMITMGTFYAFRMSSLANKLILIFVVGFFSATLITLALQKIFKPIVLE